MEVINGFHWKLSPKNLTPDFCNVVGEFGRRVEIFVPPLRGQRGGTPEHTPTHLLSFSTKGQLSQLDCLPSSTSTFLLSHLLTFSPSYFPTFYLHTSSLSLYRGTCAACLSALIRVRVRQR